MQKNENNRKTAQERLPLGSGPTPSVSYETESRARELVRCARDAVDTGRAVTAQHTEPDPVIDALKQSIESLDLAIERYNAEPPRELIDRADRALLVKKVEGTVLQSARHWACCRWDASTPRARLTGAEFTLRAAVLNLQSLNGGAR